MRQSYCKKIIQYLNSKKKSSREIILSNTSYENKMRTHFEDPYNILRNKIHIRVTSPTDMKYQSVIAQ